MRPYLAALFLSSCAILAPNPGGDHPPNAPAPAADTDSGPEAEPGAASETQAGRQEGRKARSRLPSPPAPAVSSCANLDAGNLKETIKAKLDCIKENAK
ncbi:MAG TPA: hypothetical protein VHB01_09270 [Nitrosospira sp.]|jgi:hypothetical protein|nr:hypothetical protein [Nitrosospira sp.]